MYFPPVPRAFDEDGNAYVKSQDGYCYMANWYWASILMYMNETENAIEELQGLQ